MMTSPERVRAAFEHKEIHPVVKAELWLGKEPFRALGIEDDLEGHIRLIDLLGMDILFLPVKAPGLGESSMDYRRFELAEMGEAAKQKDLFTGVVVDGPFQRLVEKNGLLPFLSQLKQDETGWRAAVETEAEDVQGLIRQCLRFNTGAVAIADDLAFQQSTYINPDYYARFLFPIYTRLITDIHSKGAYALFHSCGNITALIPHLISCGFDGLAACQAQCIDLMTLKAAYGKNLCFLAGIDADLLDAESLTEARKKEFCETVGTLSKGGGFMLCSSCGLYSSDSHKRLHELYAIADKWLSK